MTGETVELRCEGGSDDTFGVYGAGPDDDFDNCASGKPITFRVSHLDEAMYVVGQHCPGPCGGWLIGIATADSERNIPNWPMRFEQSERPYSPALIITAPKGVTVKHVRKSAIRDEE